MKRAALITLAILPCSTLAMAPEQMADMSISMMKASGMLASNAQCLGISEASYEGGIRHSMETCLGKISPDDDEKLDQCMQETLPKRLDISLAELNRCDEEADEAEEMNDPEAMQAMARQQMALMQKMSQGTEKQITLPIYPNSQMIIHLTDGMMMDDEKQETLPAATLASKDNIDSVIQFYQKKLPNFAHKKLSEGEYLFMRSMPAGFDILKNFEAYTSTPHVLISKLNGNDKMVPGAKTKIEIAYKK